MDKLVDRVTVVKGDGGARETETVFDSRHEDQAPTIPIDSIVRSVTVIEGPGRATVIHQSPHWPERRSTWQFSEDGIRRFLKADMIRAQEAYRNHRESATDDKQLWWLDLPANMIRAFIKAGKEAAADSRAKAEEAEIKADAADHGDEVRSTAAGAKGDVKAKASEIKSKAKGI